ncbi:MAG: hypothetical protein Q4G24_10390 [Paracoccus sp. (in: a-proteobacteria)]|uniref:DUF6691 family protein n=1 Tax=Paracoccus sp. TaxID=267 RepID=UPI0026DFCBA5|nr:DUF6691 family protein [Paracoccus sp. (in: a-proteobacteria)]MDO5621866.1 hypothetical protein [Paracoccus sp. (in: a-proteobacteria)]
MKRLIAAFAVGLLFGMGLLVSGMTQPARVRGWLDVFGAWDPTLGFVLGGALIPMALAWRIAAQRAAPVNCGRFPAPAVPLIDARLLAGSVLFGLGWGLSGLCPAPAVASLGFGGASFWIFFTAMVAGMAGFGLLRRP